MALSRESWIRAALFAIADGGTAAVAVEPLAERLGATKGSFYWHFRNRDELIEEALALWEREGTDAFIERLAPVTDPVERLRRLLAEAMDDEAEDRPGRRGPAGLGRRPLVAPVIDRVQRRARVSRALLPRARPASGGRARPCAPRLQRLPRLVRAAARRGRAAALSARAGRLRAGRDRPAHAPAPRRIRRRRPPRWSLRMRIAALWPQAAMTPPPGCVPAPHR